MNEAPPASRERTLASRRNAVKWALRWAAVSTVVPALGSSGCANAVAPGALPPSAAQGLLFGPPAEPEGDTFEQGSLPATRIAPAQVPPIAADLPSRGPLTAPVVIQVFSDFECPYCAHAADGLRKLEAEFGSSVRVVWRNFPLPMHPHARLAAATALEVFQQRGGAAFWRFHDAVFAAQQHGIDAGVLEELARAEGVDVPRLRARLSQRAHDARIYVDLVMGERAGVDGTPALLINDWLSVGALPYPALRAVVRAALRESVTDARRRESAARPPA